MDWNWFLSDHYIIQQPKEKDKVEKVGKKALKLNRDPTEWK